ncbi:hypothetical protein ACFQ60_36130 [Streptomyces zhihengii]
MLPGDAAYDASKQLAIGEYDAVTPAGIVYGETPPTSRPSSASPRTTASHCAPAAAATTSPAGPPARAWCSTSAA